jgi:S1-C subfamily serine protease
MVLRSVVGRRAARLGIMFLLLLSVGAVERSGAQAKPPPQTDLMDILNDRLADAVADAHIAVVSIKGHIRRSTVEMRVMAARHPELAGSMATRTPITGSGFLLPGGIVVTAAEVVAGVSNPSVVLADGKSVRAIAMSSDERSNIAILKIKIQHMETGLHWGDPTKLRAGYLAITIGNQSGFANSAALGMISVMDQKGITTTGGRHYDSLIQFQGEVGGGSIGSPLLNLHGEVIGMVVAAMIGPGVDAGGARPLLPGGSTMGFAVPATAIRESLDGLLQSARPLPPAGWFGIDVDKHRAPGEVAVSGIYIDSPAEHAGVQPGDVVLSIDDAPIRSEADLQRVSEQLSAGQKVRMALKRGDRFLNVQLDITPKPDPKQWKIRSQPEHVGMVPSECN